MAEVLLIPEHGTNDPSKSPSTFGLSRDDADAGVMPAYLHGDLGDFPELAVVDESCFDAGCSLQRVADVLGSGNADEVRLIAPELGILREHCPSGLVDVVLPVICDKLPSYPTDVQLQIGEDVLLLETSWLTAVIAKQLGKAFIQILSDTESSNIEANGSLHLVFGSLLHKVIPLARWTSPGYHELLCLSDSFRASSHPCRRIAGLKILGGVSLIPVDPSLFDGIIIARILSALPDRDPAVTAAALKALSPVLSVTSNPVIYDRLWLEVFRIWDSDVEASALGKAEAIMAASEIIDKQTLDLPSERPNDAGLTCFYRSLCRFAVTVSTKDLLFVPEAQCRILSAIASEFGPLTLFSSRQFDARSLRAGIDAFTALSTCNEGRVRAKCAFNLPGLSFAFKSRHKRTLVRVLQVLATDEVPEVREAVALGMHETFRFLADRRNAADLFSIVESVLNDVSAEVRTAALKNLGSTVLSLRNCDKTLCCDEFVNSSLCKHIIASDWRSGESIVHQVSIMVGYLSASCREESLVPVLKQVFQRGVPPVRKAAGAAIIKVISSLPGIENRRNVVTDFCAMIRTEGCTLRVAIADTLLRAVDVLSKKSFQDLFAVHLFALTRDPVVSVRLRIATDLHRLAPAFQELPYFSKAIETLACDEDVQVREAMFGFIRRASACVQYSIEEEDEDRQKLENEMFVMDGGADRARFTTSPPFRVGIVHQLNKILTRRHPARRPMRKSNKALRRDIGVSNCNELASVIGSGGDILSTDDDSSVNTESEADLHPDVREGGESPSNKVPLQLVTASGVFPGACTEELSHSLVTPESTRPLFGENLSDIWPERVLPSSKRRSFRSASAGHSDGCQRSDTWRFTKDDKGQSLSSLKSVGISKKTDDNVEEMSRSKTDCTSDLRSPKPRSRSWLSSSLTRLLRVPGTLSERGRSGRERILGKG